MDELTNRSRSFAEAVVTMVWLLFLPGLTGLHVPYYMLVLGGSTIVTGICPLIACCTCKNKRAISDVAALISAAILFSLACWIAMLTVSELIVVFVATLSVSCTGFRIISYCRERKQHGLLPGTKEFHTILDGSHEFLWCMTGIHFLWLGSLAWEGLVTSKGHGVLSKSMGTINIFCCAIGLCTILVQMTPPVPFSDIGDIARPLFWSDATMIISIGTVLGVAMCKSLVLPWWLLLIVGTLILICPLIVFFLLTCVRCPDEAGGSRHKDPPKVAPLGLTKLMVTGFLTVSISVSSTHRSITNWFLLFAAAAIISGLTWRLLTQAQVREMLENKYDVPVTQDLLMQDEERKISDCKEIILCTQELPTQDKSNIFIPDAQARILKTAVIAYSAKTACICTHIFVATATAILMIDIYNVKNPMSAAAAPSRAPCKYLAR